jgi:hypothetical protein
MEVRTPLSEEFPDYDFHGAKFDLDAPVDREILQFVLSQALFGEATGVYCGKSLYAAGTLEPPASTYGKRVSHRFTQKNRI